MKISLLSIIAVAVLSATSLAYADPQTITAPEALSPMGSVTVTARRFHIEPQEFMDYEYSYNLSNGEMVQFSRRVRRFYVSIKGQPQVEIFATATDQFLTRDGAKLVFTEDGNALTIDHFELLQLASGMPIAHVAAAK